MKEAIVSLKAPGAIGPYSQAIKEGEWIFVSGQIPLEDSGALAAGVKEQTRQALKNIAAILEAAGLGLEAVVKTTVYMTDLAHFAEMNEVYAQHFKAPYPARATLQVSALPKGASVEIEAVASRKA